MDSVRNAFQDSLVVVGADFVESVKKGEGKEHYGGQATRKKCRFHCKM